MTERLTAAGMALNALTTVLLHTLINSGAMEPGEAVEMLIIIRDRLKQNLATHVLEPAEERRMLQLIAEFEVLIEAYRPLAKPRQGTDR
jgi:hypothetical protein